jgi:hypothetical protein
VNAERAPSSGKTRWWPPRAVRRALFGAAFRLGVTGLIAIGLAGLLALTLGTTVDKRFVSGDAFQITYTKARCAEYIEYEPTARSCDEAATLHHFGEEVGYGLSAGLLGLLGLAAYVVLSRRWRWMRDRTALPDGFEATIATSLFGIVAVVELAESLNQLGFGDAAGIGAFLSRGLVSLAVAAAYGFSLLRTLSSRADSVGRIDAVQA